MASFFRNHFFRNIYLTYIVLISGLVLLSFGMYIYQADRGQQEKIYQDVENKADLMTQILDDKFNDIELIAAQIMTSKWGKYVNSSSDILYSKVDYYRKQEICQVIDTYDNLFGIAKSTAIIYVKKNMAVDSVAFWDCERYFKSVGLPGDFMDIAVEITEQNYNAVVLYRENESSDLVMIKRLDFTSHPSVILLEVLDNKMLQRYFKVNMPDVVNISILLDGRTLYTCSNNEYDSSADKSYEITQNSNMYQWEYCFQISRSNYERSAYTVWIYFFSFLGMVLLTHVLGYGLARYTYRPIRKIAIKMNIYKNNYMAELEDIGSVYEDMKLEKEKMENLANQYYEIARNGFLISLLKGNYDNKYVEESIEQFHTDFKKDMQYMVLAITNIDMGMQQKFMGELLKFQSECCHNEIYSILFQMSENYVMISGTMKDAAFLQKMSDNIGLLMDEYLDGVDTELFIGGIHKEIRGVHKSWQEVEDKMMNGKLNGVDTSYYYPFELESRLINTMRVGNFAQAEKVLWEIRTENEERGVSSKLICKVVRLIYEGFTRFSMEGMINWAGDDSAFREMVEEKKLSESWNFLRECIHQMEKAYYYNERINSIGEHIVTYMQQNYTDSNISQQIIADNFNISRSAVSKLFKETTGINFIEYLHRLRIAHAKELIGQGNHDVIDVASQSGYENEITFKRAFVKYEGVTPREYVKRRKRES